ncbi:MAG: hypothetical protein K9G44_04885, partial [Melioribacteraceae bacterium]|nr:hypothetical protein [Melioribacteraceae bacterium]
ACENQAFLYGNNILGLQFHLEMTEQGIKELAGHSKSEIEGGKYIQTFDTIVDNLNQTQSCHNLMEGLLTKFFCN